MQQRKKDIENLERDCLIYFEKYIKVLSSIYL